jgi:hypothetical protein
MIDISPEAVKSLADNAPYALTLGIVMLVLGCVFLRESFKHMDRLVSSSEQRMKGFTDGLLAIDKRMDEQGHHLAQIHQTTLQTNQLVMSHLLRRRTDDIEERVLSHE